MATARKTTVRKTAESPTDKPTKVAFSVGSSEGADERHDPIPFAFKGKPFQAVHPSDIDWEVSAAAERNPDRWLHAALSGDQYAKLMKLHPTTGHIIEIIDGVNEAAGMTALGEANAS